MKPKFKEIVKNSRKELIDALAEIKKIRMDVCPEGLNEPTWENIINSAYYIEQAIREIDLSIRG